MTTPRWRLAIVAASLMLFSAIGSGVVQAAPAATSAQAPANSSVVAPAGDGAAVAPSIDRLRLFRDRLAHPGRWGRHLVHSTVTVVGRDGELVTFQFDHGTIAAIGDGSISIAEAGGSTVTVATSDTTRVRKNQAPAKLSDLAVGDEVFVASRVEDGIASARGILVPAARPAADAT